MLNFFYFLFLSFYIIQFSPIAQPCSFSVQKHSIISEPYIYSLFQGWLLLVKICSCLCTPTSLIIERPFKGLNTSRKVYIKFKKVTSMTQNYDKIMLYVITNSNHNFWISTYMIPELLFFFIDSYIKTCQIN